MKRIVKQLYFVIFQLRPKLFTMNPGQRLLSLDFLRGLIMVLLAFEASGLYHHLTTASDDSVWHGLMLQFDHHPWNGLRFWDLVQPGFMFIAGTAMAYSITKQRQQGMTWMQTFRKALRRSGWLFFWGVLDYAVRRSGLSFELWNVLTQLSFTTLVAFLVFNWSYRNQALICVALLLLTEVLYRFTNIPGFDQPFTDQKNFGNWMDLQLMNTINKGGWVAINCIPTAVHTIAGAMVGKFLLQQTGIIVKKPTANLDSPAADAAQGTVAASVSDRNTKVSASLRPLLFWGLISLIVGYGLDWTGITPIIKRIATTSFTMASLGWCLWALAACYWWIDILQHRKYLRFFTIVGMNSIFIYLFFEIVGARWFNGYVGAVTNGLMSFVNVPELPMLIITSLCIFTLEWLMCYFLYKKKIFFRV